MRAAAAFTMVFVSLLLAGCASQSSQPTTTTFNEAVADNWYPSTAPTAPTETPSAVPTALHTVTPRPTRVPTATPTAVPTPAIATELPAPQAARDFAVSFRSIERRQDCVLGADSRKKQCLVFKLAFKSAATELKVFHYAYMAYVYDSDGTRWELTFPSKVSFSELLSPNATGFFEPIYVEYNRTVPLGPALFSFRMMGSARDEVVLNYSIRIP